MNLFDVLILGIITFCLLKGVFRGLIKEVLSLIVAVVGFCAASYFYAWIAEFLSNWLPKEIYFRIFGFLSVFFGIVIIISLLVPMIKYILGIDFIRGVDRSFGGGVGMTKGVIFSSILLIVFTAFLPKDTSIISDSQLSRHLIPFSEKLIFATPKEMEHEFFEKIESYKKTWENHN